MERQDMETARDVLMLRRARLIARRQEQLTDENELLAERRPDWEDRASDVTTARVLDRLSETELFQLHRIHVALTRIDGGTYGTCVVCHEPIPVARLRALPEADRCAGCSNSH